METITQQPEVKYFNKFGNLRESTGHKRKPIEIHNIAKDIIDKEYEDASILELRAIECYMLDEIRSAFSYEIFKRQSRMRKNDRRANSGS